MFVEVNTQDAARLGVKDGAQVWVHGPEGNSRARMKALVTDRVGPGVAFMPFHFAGFWEGESQRSAYPPGTDPIVLGRVGQRADDLRLRPGDLHAGNQVHPLPNRRGLRRRS